VQIGVRQLRAGMSLLRYFSTKLGPQLLEAPEGSKPHREVNDGRDFEAIIFLRSGALEVRVEQKTWSPS